MNLLKDVKGEVSRNKETCQSQGPRKNVNVEMQRNHTGIMGEEKKKMKCKVEVEHVSRFMRVTVNQ